MKRKIISITVSCLHQTSVLLLTFAIWGCHDIQGTAKSTQLDHSVPDRILPVKDFVAGEHPPFKECHASTILRLKNGSFLIAWFAGEKEKNDNVGIWMVKGSPKNWTSPFEVAKIRNDAHWNPVLFASPTGRIFLFFKVGKDTELWETWYKTSDDEGSTWTEARELVKGDKGGRGPVRSKPIILSDGTWLAGASHEYNGFHVFTDRSMDSGASWIPTPYLSLSDSSWKGKELIQPTLWESNPGLVHMLIRSELGSIFRSDSKDFGKTWSALYRTSLPNPNSGIDVTKLPDGTLVLAYNPDNHNDGDRAPLLLATSFDNGLTWPKSFSVEEGKGDDEFSYPGLINFGDTLAMSYTWQRKNIAFWMGTKKDLLKEGH
jgi:predicted neuraminidase